MRSRSQPLGGGLLHAVGALICLFLLTSLASGHVLEYHNTTVRLKRPSPFRLSTSILTLLLPFLLQISGLWGTYSAHEMMVPNDAWTGSEPPYIQAKRTSSYSCRALAELVRCCPRVWLTSFVPYHSSDLLWK